MTTAATVTARKPFRCDDSMCRRVVQAGEEYARCVSFPSDDFNSSGRVQVLRLCRDSATEFDRPMPPRRTKTRSTRVTAPTTPKRRKSEQRQRTHLMAVRLLPSERDALQAAADRHGVTLAAFVLSAALAAAGGTP